MTWDHNGYYAEFKCPLCKGTKYVRVSVKKPNGHWYVTELYKCFSCSVMFTDPLLFTLNAASLGPENVPEPGGAYKSKENDGTTQ